MAKYVIEIPDERESRYIFSSDGKGLQLMIPVSFGEHDTTAYFTGLSLSPYTEPDRGLINGEESKIHVGDEVIPRIGEWKGVVLSRDAFGKLLIMDSHGKTFYYLEGAFRKTGRSFDIAGIQRMLRG